MIFAIIDFYPGKKQAAESAGEKLSRPRITRFVGFQDLTPKPRSDPKALRGSHTKFTPPFTPPPPGVCSRLSLESLLL